MIKPVTYFMDSTGAAHASKELAYKAEIALLLGKTRAEGGSIITTGLIALMWDNREKLAELLTEIDCAMVTPADRMAL